MNFPYLVLHTPPRKEPIYLHEIAAFLGPRESKNTSKMLNCIVKARLWAERYLKRSLITQTWLLSYDTHAPSEIVLPKGPIQSIDVVKLLDRNANEMIVPSSNYYLNAGKEKLVFDAAQLAHIVEIQYTAGYGDPSDVPEDLKYGILKHAANLYDNYDEEVKELPSHVKTLYAPYRVVRF